MQRDSRYTSTFLMGFTGAQKAASTSPTRARKSHPAHPCHSTGHRLFSLFHSGHTSPHPTPTHATQPRGATDDFALALGLASGVVALEAALFGPRWDLLLAGAGRPGARPGAVGLQLKTGGVGSLLSADSLVAALVLEQACWVAAQVGRAGRGEGKAEGGGEVGWGERGVVGERGLPGVRRRSGAGVRDACAQCVGTGGVRRAGCLPAV